MRRCSGVAGSNCINGSPNAFAIDSPSGPNASPKIVAHHFTGAGLPKTAIEWWSRAGTQAMHRFANHEAALSYANGLNLIAELPPGEERNRQQLAFRLALGPALLAARGYASDEVESTTRRRAGSPKPCPTGRPYSRALVGDGITLRPRPARSSRAGACRAAMRHRGDDASAEKSCLAFRALGSTLMSKGEFVRAIEAFDGAITRGNQASLSTCFAHHGEEPHIVGLQYKGLSLAVRGHAATGLATALVLSLAKTSNFPLMVAFARPPSAWR